MKKETKQDRANIINNTYFYIYKNLETNICLDDLAKINSISKYHFHRIFKEETNKTPFEAITSIRLQKAANLLITNKYSTISQIADKCGYISHSSFIKAFKNKFTYTPTQWRRSSYKKFSKEILQEFPNKRDFSKIEPKIEPVEGFHCIYIREEGYGKNIIKVWEKLKAHAYEQGLQNYKEIALYHDNPSIIALKHCEYVACIEVEKDFKSSISTLFFPSSLCAVFNFKGEYGDILNFIRYVYHFWLPNSSYEAKTIPAYTRYHKNHFSSSIKNFDLTFYLPITCS